MSIEQTLERIAVGIETLITLQGTSPVASPGPAPVAAPPAPVAAPPPMPPPPPPGPASPNVAPFPPQAPPMPGPSGIGPGQAMPPVAAPPPGPAQVAASDLLDQIRDAANTFYRTHPDRGGEIWAILAPSGAQKIDAIPPQYQAQILQQIQALGA